MTDLSFFRNKTVLFVAGISLGILILVVIFSPKRNVSPPPSSPPLASVYRPELINLGEQKRREAAAYRTSITDRLPIYVEGFKTSVGIKTTINIFSLPSDPVETIHFEIYGPSYLVADASEFTNPNLTAFKESHLHGLELMKDQGIDPQKLIFIYADKEYVRNTTRAWLDKLGLAP